MANFFKNLLFSEDKPETAKSSDVTEKTVASAPVSNGLVPSSPSVNMTGVINPEIYKMLKAAIEARNIPGPDYLELKNSANAMSSILPDENQRFIAAYASLKATAGITKAKVIESIDTYINVVKEEQAIAEKELQNTYTAEVVSRQNKMAELNAQIEKFKQTIVESQEKILSLSQEINAINSEKMMKENELEISKRNFDATISAVVNEFSSDKNKLTTIITE